MIEDSANFSRPPDGEVALATTLDWLRTPGRTNESGELAPRPIDGSRARDTLAVRLSAAGLTDWSNALAAAAGPGQPLHLDDRLSWLMGRTAFEVAVDVNQQGLFRVVEELQMLGRVSDVALASAVCSRVANEAGSYPLLEILRTRLMTLWNSHFNDRLRHYAEATLARMLTSRDFWAHYQGMPLGDGWAHLVAATLWPDRYMEMLASFPVPFQHGFSGRFSEIDLNLVASLISASPDVFSSEGVPLGPVVIFGILDVTEARFASVANHDVDTFRDGLDRVIDAVFARRDGSWIARAWLQQVIWRDTPRRAGRAQADVTMQRTLRDTLLAQLAGRITPLGSSAFDWIRQEEPLWTVHRVLSEASILEAHGDAGGAAEILAGAVRQGLVSSTGRPAGLVTTSPEAVVVARVLSQLPDMKVWFEALWRDTHELREQLSYPAHRGLDNPAYPVIAWGLIGLNASQEAHVDTAGFWRTIGSAVFETQLIDPNAHLFNGAMPPITRVAVQLGAALVERGVLPINDFALFLADQLEPTIEYARLWQITRSEVSDATTLAIGRLVGTARLRLALEAGLTQNLPGWDVVPDRSARDDLAEFLRCL